jgi:hypothetical protein
VVGELVVADGPADRLGEDDGGVGADLDGGAFALFSRCSRPVMRDPISTSPPYPSAIVRRSLLRIRSLIDPVYAASGVNF